MYHFLLSQVTQAFLLFSYVSLCHKTAQPAFSTILRKHVVVQHFKTWFYHQNSSFLSINFNNKKGEIIILIWQAHLMILMVKNIIAVTKKCLKIKLIIIVKSALSILYEIYPGQYLMGCCECIISSYHFTDFLKLEEKNSSLSVRE